MAHHNRSLLGRRSFLRHGLSGAAGLSILYSAAGCGPSAAALLPPPGEEPSGLPSVATLSTWGEAGAPLVVRGRVFAADGKAPVVGLTLYVYHTDARGFYSENDGNGREPRRSGWVGSNIGAPPAALRAYPARTMLCPNR